MKIYILIDDQNIVRCIASEECNLHKDKLWMRKFYVEGKGTVGDEYDPITDAWIPHPEHYPQPSKDELKNQLISVQMQLDAVKELKKEGDIDWTAEEQKLEDEKVKLIDKIKA